MPFLLHVLRAVAYALVGLELSRDVQEQSSAYFIIRRSCILYRCDFFFTSTVVTEVSRSRHVHFHANGTTGTVHFAASEPFPCSRPQALIDDVSIHASVAFFVGADGVPSPMTIQGNDRCIINLYNSDTVMQCLQKWCCASHIGSAFVASGRRRGLTSWPLYHVSGKVAVIFCDWDSKSIRNPYG